MNYPLVPYDPKLCSHAVHHEIKVLDIDKFKTNSPVLEGVRVIERWHYWDGVLSGICEIHGEHFYFDNIIESIWRYYDKMKKYKTKDGEERYLQSVQRLWRIFAVYNIDVDLMRKQKFKNAKERNEWLEERDAIGIFWDYERDWKK